MATTLYDLDRTLVLGDGRLVRLRRAEEDDAPACVAHLDRVGGESPFLTFGPEGPGVTEEDVRRQAARTRLLDNALFLVAEANGEVVGVLTFECGERRRVRHTGEFGLSVTREHQGAGIGRALVEHLVRWAETGGVVRKLNLRVRVDNARAIALYERLGFATEGRISRDLLDDGVFHDAYWMGRAVDPRP
jgi:RimJ/RimL family protein N-acetyltransferase